MMKSRQTRQNVDWTQTKRRIDIDKMQTRYRQDIGKKNRQQATDN